MELILSAIASGGLTGVADQYLCLLIVGIGGRMGWLTLSPEMDFMQSWLFLGPVLLFWVLTVAPAYLSLLAPGVANSINTAINFISGFIVPLSSALMSLASVGIISGLDPTAEQLLETIHIFNPEGGIGVAGLFVAGGAAVTGSTLTATKAAVKPALSTSTGTLGTASAPLYATLENIASVAVVTLIYALANTNPWLLVLLFLVIIAALGAALVYALRQLRKTQQGIGRVVNLMGNDPKAGWAVILEFLVWGSGWLMCGNTRRGIPMLAFWGIYALAWWGLFTLSAALPFLLICFLPLSLILFWLIGMRSARKLMDTLPTPSPAGKTAQI